MLRQKQKQQKAYSELIRSGESLAPWEKLPVRELPDVQREQRKEFRARMPLIKRVGETALYGIAKVDSAVWGYISGISKNNSESMKKASEEYERTGRGNYAAYLATNSLTKIVERRRKHWKSAGEKAETKFREEHPNVALHEAELREKWKGEQAEKARRRASVAINDKSKWIVDYFRDGRIGSFSKAIPRRPNREGAPGFTGDYIEYAKDTMGSALERREEDGSIPLLGRKLQKERMAQREQQGQSISQAISAEKDYADGVGVALWQLGFVEFEDEKKMRQGQGRLNPDTQWGETADHSGVTARIPFNPENELHQMMMPEGGDLSNPMIEVEMNQPQESHKGGLYMNLRAVEAQPAVEGQPTPMAMAA